MPDNCDGHTRRQGIPDEWRRVGDWRVRCRDDHPTRTLEANPATTSVTPACTS
jgi:hypothetical protein